jgi:hypothetical protein
MEPASSHMPAATGRLGRFRDPILPVAPATGLARSSAAAHVFDRAKQMPKKGKRTQVCVRWQTFCLALLHWFCEMPKKRVTFFLFFFKKT